MRQPVLDPTSAVRTTMTVVTASIACDYDRVNSLAADLNEAQSRFGLLVLAEYLARAFYALSSVQESDLDDLWRSYCLHTEQTIQRAADAMPPSPSITSG